MSENIVDSVEGCNDNENDALRSVSSLCQEARSIWLSSNDCDICQVEYLYRKAWTMVSDGMSNKKPRLSQENDNAGNDTRKNSQIDADFDFVGEKLALLLLQTGRAKEADEILSSLGYICRLAESVLNYTNVSETIRQTGIPSSSKVDIPCRIYQNFFRREEMDVLRDVFVNPSNSYWLNHNYQVEPPSPYVSYLLPLRPSSVETVDSPCSSNEEYGLIGILVGRLQKFLANKWDRNVNDATFCEMWAHNRPHATGHQFHFDSDNEGCGRIVRNPICSTVVYLTSHDSVGGPSVVTNQRLMSRQMADKCWLCFPSMTNPTNDDEKSASHPNGISNNANICVFHGNILHGVVPGKPCSLQDKSNNKIGEKILGSVATQRKTPSSIDTKNRVTVMFAFWKRIRVRGKEDDGKEFGAARPFPSQPEWARTLRRIPRCKLQQRCDDDDDDVHGKDCEVVQIDPIWNDRVYETVGGQQWTRKMGFPDYDRVFQGF